MKKFMSVILAALVLVSPMISAFATQTSETIEWYFCMEEEIEYCDPWIYDCMGEITVGENEVGFINEEGSSCYTFNAENAGYYYVECLEEEIGWFGFPEEIKNNTAFHEKEAHSISGSDIEKKTVFKLDAGETFFGVDLYEEYEEGETYTVKIEYLGEEITDFTFDEEITNNLIKDVDVFDGGYSGFGTDVTVEFSSGKTLFFPEEWLELYTEDSTWKKGENNITIWFMGFGKEVTVTVYELTDFIADVEFTNYDEFKNITTSYNNYLWDTIYGAKLDFIFTDGEKVSVDTAVDEIIEINGREHWFYVSYAYESPEDVSIEIAVENCILKTYDCNATKSSLSESARALGHDVGSNLRDAFYYFRLGIAELFIIRDETEFEDAWLNAVYYFGRAAARLSNCTYLFELFIDYNF